MARAKKEETKNEEDVMEVSKIEFPELKEPTAKVPFASAMFDNIPVKITAELGSATVSLKDVYDLTEGAVVELSRHAGEPLDLLVNGQLVAQGEVVAVDNNYGIRIKSIVNNE